MNFHAWLNFKRFAPIPVFLLCTRQFYSSKECLMCTMVTLAVVISLKVACTVHVVELSTILDDLQVSTCIPKTSAIYILSFMICTT